MDERGRIFPSFQSKYGNWTLSAKGGQRVSKPNSARRERPQIIVERVYLGGKPMKQVFQRLATEQVQKNWNKIAEQAAQNA
jgi:hypothetical protein